MKAALRRCIAAGLCAALVSPPLPVWAEAARVASAKSNVNAKAALAYLQGHGVFKDHNDPLRLYLGDDKKLTPLGEILYRYLRAQPNPAETVEGMQESFKTLAKSGPYSEKKAQAFQKQLERYVEKFGDIPKPPDAGAEDTFRAGTLTEAYMTGAAAIDTPKQDFTRIDRPDEQGFEYWDKDGRLAYKFNKHKVEIFNGELRKMQREMNKNRPPQAPFIPETGVYNQQMFLAEYWILRNQYDQIEMAMRLDRLLNMAELLGKQYKDDVWFDRDAKNRVNERLEKDLEALARKKTFEHKDKKYSVLDIVEAKIKRRRFYLNKSVEGLNYYVNEVDKLKGAKAITDQKINAMQMSEQFVKRHLTLAYLETQKFQVRSQLERLDPDSPDSQMIREALKKAPMDAATRAKFRGEGDKLHARLDRLSTILGRVEDVLVDTDYASNLDMAQSALNSSQKDLSELGLNYSLFAETPSVFLALKKQTGSWLPTFNNSYDPRKWSWGLGRRAYADSNIQKGHSARMGEVDRSLSGYSGIAKMLADGNYWGARQAFIRMRPDAAYDKPVISLSGESSKVTEAGRIMASVRETRELVGRVDRVNRWVNTASSFAGFVVGMGFGAPVLRKTFAVVEVAATKAHLNFIAACAEQIRLRLATLEPSIENMSGFNPDHVLANYLRRSSYRMVTVAQRQALFTTFSGTISGTFTMVGHWTDKSPVKMNLGIMKIGEGHSNFRNSGDALRQGAEQGVIWANQSFHPALGYIGLPSSYFEGMPIMASVTEILGQRGVVGSLWQGAKWLVGKATGRSAFAGKAAGYAGSGAGAVKAAGQRVSAFAGRKTFSGGVVRYGVLKPVGFVGGVLAMADNVFKYAAISEIAKRSARFGSWMRHHDEPDVGQDPELKAILGLERRVKRADQTGMKWAEAPIWLLIPIFPAKYEEAARGYQRSVQGEQEYIKAGRQAELANVEGDQSYLPMLGKNKPPFMQRVFNFTFKGARDADSSFLITKEIKRRAISDKLKEYVSGGGKNPDLATLNPEEFLKISRSDSKRRSMVGELYNTDDVRFEARKLCIEALLKNQDLALRLNKASLAELILSAKPGSKVEGFGRVTPSTQREVATMMLDEAPAGAKVSAKVKDLARGFVQRYLDANSLAKPNGPADLFIRDARANTHESKAEAETFRKTIDEVMLEVNKWEDAVNNGLKKPYSELVKDLRKSLDAKLEAKILTKEQHAVLKRWFDVVDAQEAYFNYFNNVETAHKLIAEEISALRVQFEGGPGLQKVLDGFTAKLDAWRDAVPAAERSKMGGADTGPGGGFKKLIGGLNKDISDALAGRSISAEEAALLRESVNRDIAGAPWILHDSKGNALQGWRPAQFVTYMTALADVAEQAKGGAPIRGFLRLTTGGGKTPLSLIGLEPIAAADARLSNTTVGFFTVQSNLDAQAQLEWRAYKRIGSKIEFDTYEGLKSKIAEGKNKGQKYAEKIWILGDEMDGAALQPALTLGETTGRITRKNAVYTRMEQLNDRMEQLVLHGTTKLGDAIKSRVRQAQSAIDGLDARAPEALAARKATEGLLKSAEELGRARTPEARLKAEQSVRLRLKELNSAMASSPLASFPESMSKLFPKAQELQAAADGLAKGSPPEALGRVRQLLKEQQKLLDAKDLSASEQAKSLRRSTAELLAKLDKPSAGVDLPALIKDTLESQQALMRSTSRVSETAKSQVEGATSGIARLLQEGAALEPGDFKAARQEMADTLKLQKNLLSLVEGKSELRGERLRLEATGLRENAQARLEAIQKKIAVIDGQMAGSKGEKGELLARKTALESESRLARHEISLAQRFEAAQYGRAQRLVEKVFELQEEFPAQAAKESGVPRTLERYVQRVSELGELLGRASELKTRIAAAEKAGEPAGALHRNLETLQSQAKLARDKVFRSLQSEKEFATLRQGKTGASSEVAELFELGRRMTALSDAGGLRENAQARLEARQRRIAVIDGKLNKPGVKKGGLLARKAALESEARMARGDLALAQRAEQRAEAAKSGESAAELASELQALKARSQGLSAEAGQGRRSARLESAQKELGSLRESMSPEQNAALDSYKENVARLYETGKRMAALDDKIAAGSGPVEALQKDLAALQAEADVIRGRLARARQEAVSQSRIATSDLAAARRQFQESGQDILELSNKGDAESQAAALRLLERRKTLLDAFAGDENPIYEIYRRMKADAYAVAKSPIWDRDDAKVARKAADKAKSLASGSAEKLAEDLKTVEGLARPGESQAAAKLRQQAESLFKDLAQKWRQLSSVEPADRAAPLKNLAERLDKAMTDAGERGSLLKELRSNQLGLDKASLDRLENILRQSEGLFQKGQFNEMGSLHAQAKSLLQVESDRAAILQYMGSAMDQLSMDAAQRQGLLKALRAERPGLEPAFAERLEGLLRNMELRETRLSEGLKGQSADLRMTMDRAADLYARRIDGAGLGRFSLSVAGQVALHPIEYLLKPAAKVLGADVDIRPMDIPVETMGMTRRYAWDILKEISADPLMPTGQRDILGAKALFSLLWPKVSFDTQVRGSSWVRTEFLNLVRGYNDDYATVRMDNLTGKTNVIHNGQWFETMDNPTRRFWELEYGTDITLPYTHKALSTIKDVTSNKKTRMFALSATAGEEYVKHLGESNIPVGGEGAKKPANVSIDVRESAGGKFQAAGEALLRLLQRSRGYVAVRPAEILASEAGAPPEVKTYFDAQGYSKKDAVVLNLDAVPPGPARDFLASVRGRQGVRMETGRFVTIQPAGILASDAPQAVKAYLQSQGLSSREAVVDLKAVEAGPVRDYFSRTGQAAGATGLLVISLPDTRAVKLMEKYLVKSGYVKQSEIAKVFSDTEYLRLNRPQAKVHEQMNLDAMKSGEVKVLLLDTRVGGRGLDLEFKGDRGVTSLDAFKGYTNYEMLVIDPNKMSAVHLLQAEGRIDLGRVLLGANRNFRLMMDVKALQKEAVFEDMWRNNELFSSLRSDAAVREFSLRKGSAVDWALVDSYVRRYELDRFEALKGDPRVREFAAGREVDLPLVRDYVRMREAEARKSGNAEDKAWVDNNNLVERYDRTISEVLDRRQELIEKDLLRQSSVLQDHPISDPKTRWLDRLSR